MGFREGETRIEEQYQLQRQRRRSQANIGTRKPINEEYTAPANASLLRRAHLGAVDGSSSSVLPEFTSDDDKKVLQIEGDALAWDLIDIPDFKTYVPAANGSRARLDFPDGIGLTSIGDIQFHTDFYTNMTAHSSDVILTNPDGTNRNASLGIFEIGLLVTDAQVPLNTFTLSGIRDGATFGEAAIEVKSLKNPAFKLVDTGFYQNVQVDDVEVDIGAIHFDAQATKTSGGVDTLYQTTFASIHASAEKATFVYTTFNLSTTYQTGARVKYVNKYYRLEGISSVNRYPDVLPSQWIEVPDNSGTYDRGKLRISLRDVDESFLGNDTFSDIIIADIDSGLLLNHSIYQPQYPLGSSIKNSTVLRGEIVLGSLYSSASNPGSQISLLNETTLTIASFSSTSEPKPTDNTGAVAAIWLDGSELMYKSNGVVAPFGGDTIDPLTKNIIPDNDDQRGIGSALKKMSRVYTNDLYVYQDADFGGAVSLGNGTSDNISINGLITSDILPRTNSSDAFTIGSLSKQFTYVYTKGFASSGDTTLGNDSSDNVTFGGRVGSHVLPISNNLYDLGSSSRRWAQLYIEGINASGDCIIGGGSSNDSLGFYGKNPITKQTVQYIGPVVSNPPTQQDVARLTNMVIVLSDALKNLGIIDYAI